MSMWANCGLLLIAEPMVWASCLGRKWGFSMHLELAQTGWRPRHGLRRKSMITLLDDQRALSIRLLQLSIERLRYACRATLEFAPPAFALCYLRFMRHAVGMSLRRRSVTVGESSETMATSNSISLRLETLQNEGPPDHDAGGRHNRGCSWLS